MPFAHVRTYVYIYVYIYTRMCNGRSSSLFSCLSLVACSPLLGSRTFSSSSLRATMMSSFFGVFPALVALLGTLTRKQRVAYARYTGDLSSLSRLSTVVEITTARAHYTRISLGADNYKNRARVYLDTASYVCLSVCVCVRACLSSPSRVFPLNKINIQLVNCYYKGTFSVCVVL